VGSGTRGPLPAALVVEVFYDAVRDDEYIVIANPASAVLDLTGWRLTDREGSIEFPRNATLAGGGRAVIARNATSYLEDTLDAAEYTYGAGNATRMIVVGRIPQLNNDGDEVLLLNRTGAVVDAFAYGASPYAGDGWDGPGAARIPKGKRAVRSSVAGGFQDTDSAADWDSLRSYGLGQSDLPFRRFEIDGSATGFLSPDDSLATLKGFLDRAATSIHAGLYTLTNPVLAESLRSAAARGVDVRLLLEGGPVGGIDEREWALASRIASSGGSVRFLVDDPADGILARYRFLHAKYAVIDSRTVVVGSENWGEHGFPAMGHVGNRGWEVAIDDRDLAAYFEDLLREDFDPRRRDSVPLPAFDPNLYVSNDTASNGTYRFAIPSSRYVGHFAVTPVVAPEHALREDALLGLLGSATETLEVEAFFVSRAWGADPNPYLEAAIDAARHGVRVRILLDGTWYNVEGDDPVDNDDTLAYVNGIARREALPLEAKIADAGSRGLSKVHTKGVLVDGRVAFVSSLNWNRNAATNNREVGLIVEGAEIVEPFRAAFERDWSDGGRPPGGDPAEVLANPLLLPLVTVLVVNVALLAAWRRHRRRGGKGLSEEEPTQ
jgi:phosphatidylserine/phosphatidylglycerophosphate/cardiolipin synthase-like enzyme